MILYLHTRLGNERARSSVGSEHLVYTQGVRGSNPFAPTAKGLVANVTRPFLFLNFLERYLRLGLPIFLEADTH